MQIDTKTESLIIAILLLLIMSCNNKIPKNTIFVAKNINNIKIVCDSINAMSEINAYFVFFHIDNYSDDNVIITINGPAVGEPSRNSFLFISPDKDTLNLYLEYGGTQKRIIKSRTKVYFTQLIHKHYFLYNNFLESKRKSYYELLNQFIKKSKMIYISDSTANLRKDLPAGYDTIYIIKNIVNVDAKNVIVNPNPPPPNSLFRFIEKRMDSL